MADARVARQPSSSQEGSMNRTSEKQPANDLADYLREYAREKPDVCALWCFGIGFVIGWKLKPW